MATVTAGALVEELEQQTYRKRIWAWTMYDWANSAFATTILAAVLPIYFSQVAGATLPSEATATAYWSLGLSISLFIVAIISPVLGTIADISRGKKRFLAVFVGLGVAATALLVLVTTGDWLLASILAILGRIGFNGSIVFYDSLLPHVAKPEDQDRVSARGYAMGYLGGGLLLAINVVMIFLLPGTWGSRLSFISVAMWWAIFSIPLFRHVPEPPAAGIEITKVGEAVRASFQRLGETFQQIQKYRQLFRYLIAFLIYNDGIGTIIGVAAIYGAELGFGSIELILALLLVQFVGIPFSLVFGSLPSKNDKRRPTYLAFVIFNLIALPITGILMARTLPINASGMPQPEFAATTGFAGQGEYGAEAGVFNETGEWSREKIAGEAIAPRGVIGFLNNPLGGKPEEVTYLVTNQLGSRVELAYNGQGTEIFYRSGPDGGYWAVELDGQVVLEEESGLPMVIDGYAAANRYGQQVSVNAPEAGEHTLVLVNLGDNNAASSGNVMAIEKINVLAPDRQSNLPMILGLVLAVQVAGMVFARATGRRFFGGLAEMMDTKKSIILALIIYAVISVWGFFLNSTVEFWFLAWMVAIVQGGSQALSRSLYATMAPASKSGEFFGLFGVMEKFASLIGPLLFAAAALIFGSSRPAILSLITLFLIGIVLLMRVDVDEGRRVALAEDLASKSG